MTERHQQETLNYKSTESKAAIPVATIFTLNLKGMIRARTIELPSYNTNCLLIAVSHGIFPSNRIKRLQLVPEISFQSNKRK